jgi:hypothetical protein
MKAKDFGKFASYIFIEGVLVFAFIMLLQVDWLVNNILYEYNLRFSLGWAVPYVNYMWIIMFMLGFAMLATAVLGYVEYMRITRLRRVNVYICKSCGHAWASAWTQSEIGGGRDSKIKIVKSCPLCNEKLVE